MAIIFIALQRYLYRACHLEETALEGEPGWTREGAS